LLRFPVSRRTVATVVTLGAVRYTEQNQPCTGVHTCPLFSFKRWAAAVLAGFIYLAVWGETAHAATDAKHQ
jgi:hypothetical protein